MRKMFEHDMEDTLLQSLSWKRHALYIICILFSSSSIINIDTDTWSQTPKPMIITSSVMQLQTTFTHQALF